MAQPKVWPPPPATEFRNLDDLRKGMKHLDVKVAHSIQHPKSGKWRSLDPAQLKRYYIDRRQHMLGEQATQQWAEQQVQPVGGESVGTAIALLHNMDKKRTLPWFANEGSGWKGVGIYGFISVF